MPRLLQLHHATLTHPTVQLCIWSSLTGLAQAAAVEQPSPTPRNKSTDVLLPVFISFLLIAFLVAAVWWARRRAAQRIAGRSTLTPHTPSQHHDGPLLIPSPVHLRITRSEFILSVVNALTATSIVTSQSRSHWTHPEIGLAIFSIMLTVIGLVLGGLSLLYAQRAVSKT